MIVAGLCAGSVSWGLGILGGETWGVIGGGVGGFIGAVIAIQILAPLVRTNVRSQLELQNRFNDPPVTGKTSGRKQDEDPERDSAVI